MHVLLLAPKVTFPDPPTPAALLFVQQDANTDPMGRFSCSMKMVLEAESNAVPPKADPSFVCRMTQSLRVTVDRSDWVAGERSGSVIGATRVLRGSVTRS